MKNTVISTFSHFSFFLGLATSSRAWLAAVTVVPRLPFPAGQQRECSPTSRYIRAGPIIPGESSSHFPALEGAVLPPPGIRAGPSSQVRHPTTWLCPGCPVIPGKASHFLAFEVGVLPTPGIRAAQLFLVRHPTSWHSRLGSSHLQVSGLPSYSRGVIPLPGIRGGGLPTSRYQGCPIIPGESSHFPAFEGGVLLPLGISGLPRYSR